MSDDVRRRAIFPHTFRGGDLFSMGLVYVPIGVALLADPDPLQPDLFHTFIPIWLRVVLWTGAGLAAMAVAYRENLQQWAFGLLCLGPAERMLSYLFATVYYEHLNRLAGTLTYLTFLVVVIRFAGRPEPIDVPLPPPLDKLPEHEHELPE